jgi:plastocyanin
MQIREMVATQNRRRPIAPILAVSTAMFWATSLQAAEVEVRIENFTFDPRVVTVKAGTEVIWENYDDIPHSIVATAAGIRSKALDTDETYAFTFAAPGTFDYVCGLHPQMKGTIEVLP